MPHFPRLVFIVLSTLLAQWLSAPGVASDSFTFHHENVLGTSLELSVLADNPEAARQAEHRVLTEIDRLA
jgi:FAD:protein FMN transferase